MRSSSTPNSYRRNPAIDTDVWTAAEKAGWKRYMKAGLLIGPMGWLHVCPTCQADWDRLHGVKGEKPARTHEEIKKRLKKYR
jgi:hypothetical protein